MIKNAFLVAALLLLTSCCTYSITMVHTQGQAADVVDETADNTPSTTVSPTVSLIPKTPISP